MSCSEKNPLVREGTSILTRMQAALAASFVKPDERQTADIILFLRRYATYLNYYDDSNIVKGDWEPFLKMDISATLAVLMRIDIRRCNDYKKLLYKTIRIDSTTDSIARTQFKFLFDLIFSLSKIVVEQYELLPGTFEYKLILKKIIDDKLLLAVANLKKLFDDFNAASLINTSAATDSSAPLITISAADFTDLGPAFPLPTPVQGLTPVSFATRRREIEYIINHNFFNAQIDSLFKAISTLAQQAAILFENTLKNFPSHTPHYALLLAFLRLFTNAQDELNKYTKKHLDFYYKEVLQLVNKKAEPDKAHLLFELQKPVSKYLLRKGELFKGGKDSVTGKELTYLLTEDVVLNKAVVEKLQSVQIVKGEKEILAASPVAQSESGQGDKLLSPDKSWFTFGNPTLIKEASAGFAIASNILFLNEGTRTITITVTFADGTNTFTDNSLLSYAEFFTGKITGDKDWYDVKVFVSGTPAGNQLVFSITLDPADPAVIPYNESIHKDNLQVSLPLLKIYLKQSTNAAYPYRLLSKDRVKSITVDVEVNGVKNLMLSNDKGTVDAAKPFKPFGEFPDSGASFYIGSKEIFQKQLTELSFDFSNDIFHDGEVSYLHKGNWNTSKTINNNTQTLSLAGNVFPSAEMDFTANEPLSVSSLGGFIRLALDSGSFSMASYLLKVKDQLNKTTIQRTSLTPVTYSIHTDEIAAPAELVLSSFAVNYKATATIPFNAESTGKRTQFLHLTPFGYYRVKYDPEQDSKKISLVPTMDNDAELFVGLNNTEPTEVVNILFQVAEGSSNPSKNVEDVKWFYLNRKNEWIKIENSDIIDRTNDFTQSGIITITLPPGISNEATALQKGLYWIKAAVTLNPDAVCKMILVQAQAAEVVLVQDETKQIEFNKTLAAGKISKLVTTAAEIKSISQPFDSLGGRTKETDEHFYTRVSERLRHKQRAISIWDYEHIILEQFPQINKVRCINHAGFYTGKDGREIFCENYPGHVTIITIPDFRNRSGINPLRPATPIGLINNIDSYLRTIISPFVKLHVKVPQFEEVQLEFNVTFHEHLDEAFYAQLLNKEIEEFLTPWAFDAKKEISFGGKIIKSSLLNFVEERPYVDFVADFIMNHVVRDGQVILKFDPNIEEAVPTSARSLLVSYYDTVENKKHLIKSPATCKC
jgi:hypothetical protein